MFNCVDSDVRLQILASLCICGILAKFLNLSVPFIHLHENENRLAIVFVKILKIYIKTFLKQYLVQMSFQ